MTGIITQPLLRFAIPFRDLRRSASRNLGTEAPPAQLQDAQYVYDGDGNMVKSTVNGTVTYYPSSSYQEVDSTSTTTIYQYYAIDGQQVAMRTVTGSQNTLNWLVTDQLGSTNVTTDANGNLTL